MAVKGAIESLTADQVEHLNALPVYGVPFDDKTRARMVRKGWIPMGTDAQTCCREAGCSEPFHLHIEGRTAYYQHGRRLLKVQLTARHKLYGGQLDLIIDWLWACHYVTPKWGYPEW